MAVAQVGAEQVGIGRVVELVGVAAGACGALRGGEISVLGTILLLPPRDGAGWDPEPAGDVTVSGALA
ncbi:hypothetical protein GCM10018790_18880 [Kitasatospora xanthocidica]|nr:hypothetical protein GCM10018790_18880 [Kitasatospora xanthocidica]